MIGFTVTLAAVLVVVVTGLVRSPASPPIGSELAATATPGGTSASSSGGYVYNFTLTYVGSSVEVGDLGFQVHGASGAIVSMAGGSVAIVGTAPGVLATYSFVTMSWQSGLSSNPTSVMLSSDDSLSLTSSVPLDGDLFVILGQHAFAGQVTALIA